MKRSLKNMRTAKGTSAMANEKGVALVMSLLMLFLFTVLGIAVIYLSSANLKSASYEKMSALAFSAAESGLTQARNDMQVYVLGVPLNGQWPAADSTVVAGVMGGAATKTYTVAVLGQSMTFAYTLSDYGSAADKTVLVTSTGTFQNVQQRIEAVIRYEPPDQIGSQECYNSKCTSVDQGSGATVTNAVNSSVTL
jgi:Tfp pilus assembly protein PilX